MTARPALVLVATPIGNLGDLSPRAVEALREADVVAAEDTRRARKLLSHAGVPAGRRLIAVHEHNEAARAAEVAARVGRGERVAYVTDAGMPGISDPGERLVRACLEAGLPVEVVPGPNAALAALAVSGLPAERFVFEGFLPRKGRTRRLRLAALASEERTVVLYESPHRVLATLADLEAALGPDRPVAVARELTKVHEEVWRGRLGEAARAVSERGPRGEYVVVVGPADTAGEGVEEETLRAALSRALSGGASVREAARSVADELGVPRRRAYEVATEVRREVGGGKGVADRSAATTGGGAGPGRGRPRGKGVADRSVGSQGSSGGALS